MKSGEISHSDAIAINCRLSQLDKYERTHLGRHVQWAFRRAFDLQSEGIRDFSV